MQKHKEILEAAINREILELKEHVDHVLKTKARELVDDKNVEICENFFYEPEGEDEETDVKKKSKVDEVTKVKDKQGEDYKKWRRKNFDDKETTRKLVARNNNKLEETDTKSDWDNKIKQGMDYLAGKGKKPKSWKKYNPDSVNAKVKDTLDKMNKGKLDPKEYD